MAIILLILHLSIFLSGSGINRKSSIKLTLVAAAEEGKNNNNNNPVGNVQCRKDHVNPPNSWNNSLNLGRDNNIATDAKILILLVGVVVVAILTLRVAVEILRPMVLLLVTS